MEITGTAQHEAWQSRALPPVEQLRTDLWSIPVPIPHNPLRYVNIHAFALDGGGLGLLDAGWGSDEGWAALTAGLAVVRRRGRRRPRRPRHPPALRPPRAWPPASGRRPAPGSRCTRRTRTRSPACTAAGAAATVATEIDFLVGLGADRDEAAADVGPGRELRAAFTSMAVPDRLLEDGDLADFPGWRMRAVHTPGHTPGHLCFAEEGTRLFFSGDHVLPGSPRTSPPTTAGAPTRCATTSTRWPPSATSTRPRCCRRTSGASAAWPTGSTS